MVKRSFSLKKLLAVMTAICIVLAVVFNWWHDYHRTKARMHTLSAAGVGWRFYFEGQLKEDGHSWNNQDRWFFDIVKTWEPVLYPEMFYEVEAMFFEAVPGRPLRSRSEINYLIAVDVRR